MNGKTRGKNEIDDRFWVCYCLHNSIRLKDEKECLVCGTSKREIRIKDLDRIRMKKKKRVPFVELEQHDSR